MIKRNMNRVKKDKRPNKFYYMGLNLLKYEKLYIFQKIRYLICNVKFHRVKLRTQFMNIIALFCSSPIHWTVLSHLFKSPF